MQFCLYVRVSDFEPGMAMQGQWINAWQELLFFFIYNEDKVFTEIFWVPMFLYINALLSSYWSGKRDDRLNIALENETGDRLNIHMQPFFW